MSQSRPTVSEPGSFLIVAAHEAIAEEQEAIRRLSFAEIHRLLGSRGYDLSTAAARVVQLELKAGTLRTVTELIVAGELVLRDASLDLRLFGSMHGGGGNPDIPPAPIPIDQQHWVIFRVVDDATSMPIDGVKLLITIPQNSERPYTTNSGVVEIHNIHAGTCDVRCEVQGARLPTTLAFVTMGETPTTPTPAAGASGSGATGANPPLNPSGPAATPGATPTGRPPDISGDRVLEVEKHKVQTGESIDSLARGAGMTWQELSLFNWGTSVPDEINIHLRDEVGCTRKTADGFNYIFTSEDDPGIVWIPRAWQRRGLPTDQVHTVRVKKPGGERERFIFSM